MDLVVVFEGEEKNHKENIVEDKFRGTLRGFSNPGQHDVTQVGGEAENRCHQHKRKHERDDTILS